MAYSVRDAVYRLRGVLVCSALFLMAAPAIAEGQDQSGSSSSTSQASPPADFRIGSPRISVGARGSWFMASAGSDIFDFVTNEFTLDKSDFNTGSFTAELGVAVNERFEILGGIDINGVRQPSEDRDEEEQLSNGTRVPIMQETELQQFNAMVSAKFSLVPRGRAVPGDERPTVGGNGGSGGSGAHGRSW